MRPSPVPSPATRRASPEHSVANTGLPADLGRRWSREGRTFLLTWRILTKPSRTPKNLLQMMVTPHRGCPSSTGGPLCAPLPLHPSSPLGLTKLVSGRAGQLSPIALPGSERAELHKTTHAPKQDLYPPLFLPCPKGLGNRLLPREEDSRMQRAWLPKWRVLCARCPGQKLAWNRQGSCSL